MRLATTLNTLQRKPVMATGDMPISLETISGFENLQRMARMFVTVPFVPDTFRAPYTDEKGKRRGCSSIEEAIGCCVVALDMAMRMKANPLAVMQNIYVVHGRPAWTAQFLLATLNNSGRFSTIRYKFQGTQGEDGWYCDLDELERLITPKTRLLVLNTPNNPTGYALSADERQRICELARRHGLRILADEVYRGLEAPDAVPPAFCDIYERAFSVGVLSKAYGLPGLRVGWIASQERDAIGALSRYKNYLSICCPTPSEALARIALKHGPAVLARNREIIARNRRIAADFFARYDHVFLHNPPQAGPIAFHGLRPDFVARFGSALAFCEHLAQSAGVLLLPGNVYDMDAPYVRMGYGRANFAENLAVLDGWLQQNG